MYYTAGKQYSLDNEQGFFFFFIHIHYSSLVSASKCISWIKDMIKTQKQGYDFYIVVWKVNTIMHEFHLSYTVRIPLRFVVAV